MHRRPSSTSISLGVASLVALAACTQPAAPVERARDIERRILAPCCRRQTLEDHDSDIARQLRAEIERRATLGEPSAAIEGDLARRYGDEIRAMPPGWDPRALLGGTLGAGLAVGGLAIVWLVRRRGRVTEATTRDVAMDDAYEDRLDDELLAVD